ncbi:MAG TPA: type IV secretion system DNA-binding domain-containing protein [Candidatus Paceibacterota bacterium]|nr:type IV secretion system DNA-binding domain-containing protein [Candidatus Paceibacterota bacterium]
MSWKYDKEKITYFAETDFRGQRVKFGIRAEDRARHMYIIGKTGMGKSTLLENLAIQDIQNGEGVCFIDPHGGTAEALLQYVPKERVNDVVYFAPFDVEYPLAMNVLEDMGPEKRPLIASGLMGAFKKVWVDAWSARMEYLLSNALLALLETPGSTLLGVNRMFADKDFREMVVNNVKDASVRSFWVDEFAKYTEKFATEAASAIQNKVGQFSANPLIRNIVGQEKSTFDIRWMMDNRKIFIVNLSKGRIGEGNAALLGAMLITKMYLAAMSRAEVTPGELKELPPFYLYVDEFQSFANESFADILSEARKYKLCLTIAHQYIDQMTDEVRSAVFGNVGTMITFRVGSTDAEVLEKEFAPVFVVDDFVSLGFAQIYLKLMIRGASSAPFSARTEDRPPMPEHTYLAEVIDASRKQFGRPREQVDADINVWFRPVKEGGSTSDAPKTQKYSPGARPDRPRYEGSSSGSRDGGGQGPRPSYPPRDNDRDRGDRPSYVPRSDDRGGQDRPQYAPRQSERPMPGGPALRDALARVNAAPAGSRDNFGSYDQQRPSQQPQQEQQYAAPQQQMPPQYQQQPPQQYAPPQQYHPAPYAQPQHPGYPYALPPAMPGHYYPPQPMPQYPYPAPPQQSYYPQHYAPQYPQYPSQQMQYPYPPAQAPLPSPHAFGPQYVVVPVSPKTHTQQHVAPPSVPSREPRREESRREDTRRDDGKKEERKDSMRTERPVDRTRTENLKRELAKSEARNVAPRVDNKSPTPEKLDALAEALKKLQEKTAAAPALEGDGVEPPVQLVATPVEEKQQPKEVPLDQLRSVLGDNE